MIKMYDLLKELFPICRSLTGNGVRQTFEILKKHIPLEVQEFPSGTKCFDWVIPDEWNIKSAWIKDWNGNKIVDFSEHNLHILGYSIPYSGEITLEDLKKHIYTDPERPDAIPYRTSYYEKRWGFCMSHRQFETLKEGKYQVHIDSSLKPGSLTLAEAFIKGKTEKEIFFSCYVCHPSMADDSISGVVMTTKLYEYLKNRKDNYYSYRFIFVPETIGAIAYLSKYGEMLKKSTFCGMVLTCVGDPGDFNYKKTRQGTHSLDRIAENILKHSGFKHHMHDFFLPGSDERQYSSPGFNIPAGSLMRSFYGLPKYHSSQDNLDFVTEEGLNQTFDIYTKIIEAFEADFKYLNTNPFCEPFLSKYGLYSTLGAQMDGSKYIKKVLSILNFSDGQHSLVDIAEKTGFCISDLLDTVKILEEKGLLKK